VPAARPDTRCADRVAKEEHSQLNLLALGQRAGEAQRVVGALAAVGLVIDDHEDSHRLMVGHPQVCVIRRKRPSPPADARIRRAEPRKSREPVGMRDALTMDYERVARRALEDVCSGRDPAGIAEVYHPQFVDHVNALEYHGTDGARQSIALYRELFPDLRFVVDEQVSEGHRVASRWTLTGTHRGRRVRLGGIVISRFEDDKIVEDWACSDTLDLARQLGAWRSMLLLVKHHRLLRAGRSPVSNDAAAPTRAHGPNGAGRGR
jgi:predicted ester cyclase